MRSADPDPLAEDLVLAIHVRDQDDLRLRWLSETRVAVRIGAAVPQAGRRRRFVAELEELLEARGWRPVAGERHQFERAAGGEESGWRRVWRRC